MKGGGSANRQALSCLDAFKVTQKALAPSTDVTSNCHLDACFLHDEVRRGKAEVLVCLVCGPVRADPVWGFWQTPNPTAAEFVPMNSLLGPGHLTHSTSTPSFSQFSGNPNLTAGGTSFGRLAPGEADTLLSCYAAQFGLFSKQTP